MSIIVEAADAPVAKLPLWPTVRLAYATYFAHFGEGLKIAALWLPLVAGVAAIGGWLQAALIAQLLANPQTAIDVAQPAHLLMLGYARNLLLAFAAVSGAVAWHRLLLLNEAPRFGGNIGTRSLWRYVGAGLLICLIAALPPVIVLVPMALLGLLPSAGKAPPAEFAIIALAYLAGIVLMMRLSLLLPARATGNATLSLKDAWQRSRGNTWRLLGGIVLCTVPPFLLIDLFFVGLTAVPFGAGAYLAQWAAASAIALCCWLLTWPIWVGFLSHAYRHLSGPA